jgi:hypothetical protein
MGTSMVAEEQRHPQQPLYSLWRKPFRVIMSGERNHGQLKRTEQRPLAQETALASQSARGN